MGLELRGKFHRGGTSVGVHRAKQLAERRDVSFRDIIAISAYFARHQVEKASKSHDWGDESDPSAGYIAWLLWGGEPGRRWADSLEAAPQQNGGGIIAAADFKNPPLSSFPRKRKSSIVRNRAGCPLSRNSKRDTRGSVA